MKNEIKVQKSYVLGLGQTETSVGIEKNTETPILYFGDLPKGEFKCNDNLSSDVISENITAIFIKNLKGLKVLKKQLKQIEKILKKQE